MAREFAAGAGESGNRVTFLSLRGKEIAFCRGCMACEKTGYCIIRDDANEIASLVKDADVIVWATPVYYYGMSGLMKTLIDRMNCLYNLDYRFREVYVLTASAEDGPSVAEGTVQGVQYWLDCYKKAKIAGRLHCGGLLHGGEIEGNVKLREAYEMGKHV